ncbi:hypothetical protein GCK32_013243 [Trichostrongylus colubriformis]|uniref:Animal hem peroxidase n=1 Tax=Trichostrongylus colubriformis TaxID=6319 RepID=A0AAN8FED3_TRICO
MLAQWASFIYDDMAHVATSQLVKGGGSSEHGIDMAAQIIQMGRDHGIPGYLQWRRHCQLDNVQSFSSMSAKLLPSINASFLEQLYASPEDVDLIVGGLAEAPLPGSLLGPTLSCLFAKQMERTKRGDRFWYENFFYPSAFSTAQLEQIRKTTLARVVCDNADDLRFVQHNVFSLPDDYVNCPVSCSSSIIESVDFSLWKDEEPKRALPITKATLEKAIRLGVEQYNRLQAAEGPAPTASGQSAIFSHATLMAPKRESLDIARTAGVLREATQVLITGTGLTDGERLPVGLDVSTLQQLLPDVEVESIIGNFTPFLGFDAPRTKARSGQELPSGRQVSNVVHSDAPEFHVRFTHMLMQFGQILDHDMMHSPVARGPNNTILNCSSCDSQETLSIHCFPIKIGKDDPFFPATHHDGRPRCMPFTRSLLGQLTLGYRNQV